MPGLAKPSVTTKVAELAGVQPHWGKLEAWSPQGGSPPLGVPANSWKANLPAPMNGIKVLGVPLGQAECVQANAAERLDEDALLLAELPELPDLQSAWALL